MNPAMSRRNPVTVPLLGAIAALAISVAACGTSDDDRADTDDRALSATERRSAEKAALAAVGGGTVTDVDASDDPGIAYEVDVRTGQGVAWDVDLDAEFAVVSKTKDN